MKELQNSGAFPSCGTIQNKGRLSVRLCNWMEKRNMNQTMLSAQTGILQSVCHEIMSGGAFPSCGTIQKMAYNTDLDIRHWLVGENNGK